ncbi:ABC transporter ATP-binding protein [Arcobacter sp. 15-2]|uniref:metal ABC transporter ATP-binding protein n=1 Tax=Arcobacter sp. 15-2 TaxID=3374109 RepID=UPI00399D5674
MSIIEIKNLTFSYDKQIILENINLNVQKQDFLAIIGPNGGGKSTLLKAILGINEIKKGTIEILGEKPSLNLSKVGYVPQNTNINTNFPIKVIEVVMMGHIRDENEKSKSKNFLHKYFKIGYNEFEKSCALNALKQVGMEEFANKKIGTLSGGQRQRVMIARALCSHPSILLLDEPTASIDVSWQKQIYDLLKELNKTITIIVVSHDISVILSYASKVAHINKIITYHDISNKENQIQSNQNDHFCEVEMLQMFGENTQKGTCSSDEEICTC